MSGAFLESGHLRLKFSGKILNGKVRNMILNLFICNDTEGERERKETRRETARAPVGMPGPK